MNYFVKPITMTTTLSFALHGVVVVIFLLQRGIMPSAEGMGQGIDIHLVSSVEVAEHQEADQLVKEQAVERVSEKPKESSHKVLLARTGRRVILVSEKIRENTVDKPSVIKPVQIEAQDEVVVKIKQATNASQQQHSIIELLHSHISDKKKYPYIARRQRREGVATIAFVLHPDGKIENAHLINSSHTLALDHAALSAVNSIEPFFLAQDYLKQSKAFQVDVAFNLF